MNKKLLFLFSWLFILSSFAQNTTVISDQLADQLQSLSNKTVTDLVYLQTSKGIYETEEDVWFKGYVLDAQYFTPSERSKTLFIQLIEDQTDKVVWAKKYEIENGFVNGHLFLDNALQEGMYTLAGYSSNSFTRMPKEFYALKKIKVVKTINTKTVVTPIEKDSIVHFSTVTEGGKLVSGIQTNLAFKAINSKGLPVDVSGTLFENNVPIFNFKSSHAGMGVFSFTPDNSKKYHIQLTEPKLNSTFDIGTIESNGKALSLLSNTKDALTFKITQTDALEETVYLRLQVRGVVYSISSAVLKRETTVQIPLTDVPQGIAEVTLFDKNGLPVAERLVYLNQEQKLTIKAELDKSIYTTRDKVSVKIKTTDQNNHPVIAHLGMSVYDGLFQNKLDSKNIQTHFLLSTQLKGNIYNPAYYFNEQNKDREKALDLLMLTQGWRAYVWNEANLKALNPIPNPIVCDELKGKIQLKNPKKKAIVSLEKKAIEVFAKDAHKWNEYLMTDSTGVFTITTNHLKQATGTFLYTKLISPPGSPQFKIEFKDNSFDKINEERKTKTTIYPLVTLIGKTNIQEISPFIGREAATKLKEVVITSKGKGIVFRNKYIGKLDSIYRNNSINGDFVCPATGLLNHVGCGVAMSDRSRPVDGKIYTEFVGGGNKSVYHYPDLTEAELLEMFNVAMAEGYYGKKVFYEAIYDPVTIEDSLPDYRNTLFWKSEIITTKKGEASVSFFCSDINSLFIGNIEGVSSSGLLDTENFQFSVRKKN